VIGAASAVAALFAGVVVDSLEHAATKQIARYRMGIERATGLKPSRIFTHRDVSGHQPISMRSRV